ncbi:MAG TPA: PepSY-associated TM helix domain-containing protein [Bordetella sp.]
MDSAPATAASSPIPARARPHAGARRGVFIKWLRKTHGWLGLWGAVLGLMFGTSGFLQNHRAIMKINTPAPAVTTVRVQVPESVAQTPEEVGAWLQQQWGLAKPMERAMRTPGREVSWGGRAMPQSEHWQLMFRTPRDVIQVEYSPDTREASARRSAPGWLGVIENLHKSNGVGVAWVLMADSFAGSLVLLSLTGLLLWTELERKKLVGATVFVVSVVTLLVVTAVTL